MSYYVPGTEETDLKKVIMSLQQVHEKAAALPTTAVTSVATAGLATGGPITSTGTVTVTAAVKADQTTATSTTTAVTPAVQQNHPSAAKVWAYITYSGATPTLAAGYNVASITAGTTGTITINFTISFTTANYACIASSAPSVANQSDNVILVHSTGSVQIVHYEAGTPRDPTSLNVVCFGTQ